MRWTRRWSLPVVAGVLAGLPVFWAFPDGLTFWRSVGIVSGWLGAGLVLASLLLMVRESWLADWLGGLERMYGWHHRLGVVAYLVLLIHPLALATDVWHESPVRAWSMLAPWQQGWASRVGWLSLIGLMLGTGLALARRLPYRRWRMLHLLLAIPVGLAVLHLLLLGLEAILFAVPLLAMALLFWRFVRSDAGLAARPYLVSGVTHPASSMVEVTLRPLALPIDGQPGQFVVAAFFEGAHFKGCGEFHPYTLSRIGADGEIALGIKALGDCTRQLQSVECGVAARVHGPFGDFLASSRGQPGLWVAGGIGITPFLAALRQMPPAVPTRLVYLYREESEAAYLDELRQLTANTPDVALEPYSTGPGAADLQRILPDERWLAGKDCYLCGPPGLLQAAVGILRDRGVPDGRIHFERFDFR